MKGTSKNKSCNNTASARVRRVLSPNQYQNRHDQVENRIINEPPRWAIIAAMSLFEANQLRQETDVLPHSRLIKASKVRRHPHRCVRLDRNKECGPNETTLRFGQSLHHHEHRRRVMHHGFIGRHRRSLSGQGVHDLTDRK